MVVNETALTHPHIFDIHVDIQNQVSKSFDDDGRPKRTGTVWTASAHIITAVIGSGVLSLAWAVAQLGWVAGPAAVLLFSFVTYYTGTLLSACYRTRDHVPVNGKRNYTYTDAVRYNLGGFRGKICGVVQYLNLFGVAIGYTIAASISMMAVKRSNCSHESGGTNPCQMNANFYMIAFGTVQIILSQILDFDQLWWLSIVAAVMSFTCSTIVTGLGIVQVAKNGKVMGSMTGVSIGTTVTQTQKMWRSFQALGDIAFAYFFSPILIEIQDTIKSKPSETKTVKRATLVSVAVTTFSYILCGCFGYAAFGDMSPRNLLTGFGLYYYNPYGFLDIANVAMVIHLVGAYQVYCQPLFAFVEKAAAKRYPETEAFKILNLKTPFRLIWRTVFVVLTTVIPFFDEIKIIWLLGVWGFWVLTVYFPVEMHIAQKKIPKWTSTWVCLQSLSAACLFITIAAAAAGSIAGVVGDLRFPPDE